MKRLLLLLLVSPLFIACSDNDDKKGEGYLTSLDNVKSGILGSWKSTTGGVWYSNYASNGALCSGFEPSGNWDSCTTYEILKSGSDYILRISVIGGNNYTDWKIVILNDDIMETDEVNGERYTRETRVK